MPRTGLVILTVIGTALCSAAAPAADFFPMNGSDLQANLTTAASNNEPDIIHLAATTYRTADNGNVEFLYDSTEPHDLTLVGEGIGMSLLDNEMINGNRVIKLATTGAGASITVQGVTIQGGLNGAGDGTGIRIETNDGDIALLDSEITDNMGGEVIGVSLRSTSGDVTLQSCQLTDNTATSLGGNAVSAGNNGTILVEDNVITGQTAPSQAGFSAQTSAGDIVFNRNLVADNHATSFDTGGVRLTTNEGDAIFTNNIVFGNTAMTIQAGVFIIPQTGDIYVVNNTIVDNEAGGSGGGLWITPLTMNTTSYLYNNIIYDNIAPAGQGADILINDAIVMNPDIELFNNDFSEFCFASGGCDPTVLGANEGDNIDTDPMFVDAGMNDFSLLADSPAIDTGTDTVPGGVPSPDFDGNARPSGTNPDMGALEFIPDSGGGCNLTGRVTSRESVVWPWLLGLALLALWRSGVPRPATRNRRMISGS